MALAVSPAITVIREAEKTLRREVLRAVRREDALALSEIAPHPEAGAVGSGDFSTMSARRAATTATPTRTSAYEWQWHGGRSLARHSRPRASQTDAEKDAEKTKKEKQDGGAEGGGRRRRDRRTLPRALRPD